MKPLMMSIFTTKFFTMWHGPDMVCHMMPTMAHEFIIGDEKDPWLEPSNGIYFA
jgi:hypothetical protein